MKYSVWPFLAFCLLGILGPTPATFAVDTGAGNYGGVLEPSISDPPANSGLMQVQLGKAGAMSGVLIWQGQRYPFKGVLRDDKAFGHAFPKKLSSVPIDLGIFLNLSSASRLISGNLSESEGGSVQFSQPIGLSGAAPDPTITEKLQPGLRISFIDPPNPTNEGESSAASSVTGLLTSVAEIPGDGFVQARVSPFKNRAARLVGRLPDAQAAFSAGSPLRGTAYAVFSSLYKLKRKQGGQLFGNVGVSDLGSEPPGVAATFRWGKDAQPDAAYYPSPFDLFISLNAVPYPKLKPGSLVPLLPQNSTLAAATRDAALEPIRSIDARILFRRGNISVPDGVGGFVRYFAQNIKIAPFHTRVVGDNPHGVRIEVDAFSGRFHGSFIHPVFNERTRFRGAFQAAVLLTPGQGRGNFRPPASARITPPPEPLESGGVRITVN